MFDRYVLTVCCNRHQPDESTFALNENSTWENKEFQLINGAPYYEEQILLLNEPIATENGDTIELIGSRKCRIFKKNQTALELSPGDDFNFLL